MSNNPPTSVGQNGKTYVVGSVGPALAQSAITAQTAASAAIAASITAAATISARGVMGHLGAIKLWDYAYEPDHPEGWTAVATRDLEEGELFEVHNWLRLMSNQPYDTITHYTPALRMLVYFERSQDAAMFKLSWGGQ